MTTLSSNRAGGPGNHFDSGSLACGFEVSGKIRGSVTAPRKGCLDFWASLKGFYFVNSTLRHSLHSAGSTGGTTKTDETHFGGLRAKEKAWKGYP